MRRPCKPMKILELCAEFCMNQYLTILSFVVIVAKTEEGRQQLLFLTNKNPHALSKLCTIYWSDLKGPQIWCVILLQTCDTFYKTRKWIQVERTTHTDTLKEWLNVCVTLIWLKRENVLVTYNCFQWIFHRLALLFINTYSCDHYQPSYIRWFSQKFF